MAAITATAPTAFNNVNTLWDTLTVAGYEVRDFGTYQGESEFVAKDGKGTMIIVAWSVKTGRILRGHFLVKGVNREHTVKGPAAVKATLKNALFCPCWDCVVGN